MSWEGADRRKEGSDHDILIRLDEKMDAVRDWQTEHMTKCHTVHDKHDARLRTLEEWKWKEAGVLGVLVFLWSWLKDKWLP